MAQAARKARARVQMKLTCPECGASFGRPASLGAHRRRAHGVAGSSVRALRAQKATARRNGNHSPASTSGAAKTNGVRTVDRDGLLATLFPHGIPAREDLMREIGVWLDHAEHLAHKSSEPLARNR